MCFKGYHNPILISEDLTSQTGKPEHVFRPGKLKLMPIPKQGRINYFFVSRCYEADPVISDIVTNFRSPSGSKAWSKCLNKQISPVARNLLDWMDW